MARTSHQRGYHFVILAISEDEFASTLESAGLALCRRADSWCR
jgi:hypothetical protein